MASDSAVRALILAVLNDGHPRTLSQLILDAYPGRDVDPELLDMLDTGVSEALPGMVVDGDVAEVLVPEPGGEYGHVWYARTSLPAAAA